MIGNIIQTLYLTNSDYPDASALSIVLMGVLLIGIFLYARALGTRDLLDAAAADGSDDRCASGKAGRRLLHAYTWLIILWLMLPIFVIIAFGFNNTKGKFNYTWQGFTLHWYRHLFDIPDLTNALVNS